LTANACLSFFKFFVLQQKFFPKALFKKRFFVAIFSKNDIINIRDILCFVLVNPKGGHYEYFIE